MLAIFLPPNQASEPRKHLLRKYILSGEGPATSGDRYEFRSLIFGFSLSRRFLA